MRYFPGQKGTARGHDTKAGAGRNFRSRRGAGPDGGQRTTTAAGGKQRRIVPWMCVNGGSGVPGSLSSPSWPAWRCWFSGPGSGKSC